MTPRVALALGLAVAALAGCGAAKNQACEPCSNADDCEAGLTCQLFQDSSNNTRNLCGDASPNMVCPPR